MDSSGSHNVSIRRAEPRTIAAVRGRVASDRIPTEFRRYLDRVYDARSKGLQLDGQNIFVYHDAPGQPGFVDVDFGVGVAAPFAPIGDVRPVALPVGEAAATTHRGAYTELRGAHEAVLAWCRAHARTLAGPRWEVYGHWVEGQTPTTDVYYLLQPAGA